MGNRRGYERADRVGQQIHRVVARLFIKEVSDPRLEKVEIVDVDLTPDLRNARIYYMMRHGEEPADNVQEALDGIDGFIQSKLASEVELKYVPDVEFRFDEAKLKGRRIDELLSGLDDE